MIDPIAANRAPGVPGAGSLDFATVGCTAAGPTAFHRIRRERPASTGQPGDMAEDARLKWWSNPSTLLRHILGLDDTHHSIALGTTIGMWIGMTPTVGMQMVIVVIVAFVTKPFFHFNRIAALITVYISNPLTMVPIYYMNYKVGTLFYHGDHTIDDFRRILEYETFSGWWATIVDLFVGIGVPLIIGSFVVATVCAAATYPAMRWLLNRFHKRKRARRGAALAAVDEAASLPAQSSGPQPGEAE
jgi:uncharacterized protein